MYSAVVRALFSLFVPGGLIFFATALLLHTGLLNKSLSALVHIYPYVVLVAGILLGWRFNRSRLVFAILILALADRSLLHFGLNAANGDITATGVGRSIYDVVAFLLPLNLAVLSLMKERGIVTLRGMVRLSVIFLQVLAVFLIYRYPELGIAGPLDHMLSKAHVITSLPLSLPALVAFAAAFLLIVLRFTQSEGVLDNGFFWALLSAFLALSVARIGAQSTVYFTSAGLVLIISVIETSHSMAFRDELTGLPGRRALEEALLKLGSTFSVAMLDIDFFKKFNDRHGHDVGDQVLRMVASKLARVSGGGKPFRYGGEEFAILFPGKLVDETVPHLERLRKVMEQTRFYVRGRNRPRKRPDNPKKKKRPRKKVTITVSIGVAERSERYAKPHQVIQAADQALYRAKNAGRNQIRS